VIALVEHNEYPIFHLDIKITFLNGEFVKELYLQLSEGFKEPRKKIRYVGKYGLK
jgi:hypothetical protein